MSKKDIVKIDPDDIGHNPSANPTFERVLAARMSRRDFMKGSVGTGAMALFGGVTLSSLAGCMGDDSNAAPTSRLLGFTAVPKSLEDAVKLPSGYSFSVLCALGDPLRAATPAFKNDGTDEDFENRFGDHHDGIEYFGLSATGAPDRNSSDRALLGLNHEATTDEDVTSFFLHANGGTKTLPRPASEVDKEMAIHGITVFEIKKTNGRFAYVRDSAFNFRIHQNTVVDIYGPARGHAMLKTKFDPSAQTTRGTLNNCGTGTTPWYTFLTNEENWAGYFTRSATDDAARQSVPGYAKSVIALNRYGRPQGARSRHGWETGGPEDRFQRWDISLDPTKAADGSEDYRNELNNFGYIVEVDPFDKTQRARKRTALGRFAHENACFAPVKPGRPVVLYSGDDSRNEYIYKWVSAANWDPADANPANRLAAGDKYLDQGKLYVAVFKADGTGEWKELTFGVNGLNAANPLYPFADQADVCIHTRLAADSVGATKMDRPEWCAVHPVNGEVYFTLTNNSQRRMNPTGSQVAPDAANPRVYSDVKGVSTVNTGNVNGHIIRFREANNDHAATTFTWDVYLFGAEANAPGLINLSALTHDQDFSSPDGLWFSYATKICWIQTDDGAYTDVTNCMMLAALPGRVGDGGPVTVSGTNVTTYMGARPTADTLKRFLVGPKGCEITGICETPDGKAIFVNIQHPGENTRMADVAPGDPNAARYESQWPSNIGYGAGKRPRSATIVITKNDGGVIGT